MDPSFMRAAIAYGRRGLGTTWPNPSVGCVIVRDGRIVGAGHTAPGGRPHAEIAALAMAGAGARGATAYVTLEPCSHTGQTGPCADALIAAGIGRVVTGCTDPDPRVNGAGLARLRAAGVAVTAGVLEAEAQAILAGFLTRTTRLRPLVTLKLASTLDGRIATRSGRSQWITGPAARVEAHALRGRHDAVMVGVGTVLADDPDLTCRIDGFRSTPVVRLVADTALRTPLAARLVATARASPTWLLHGPGADRARLGALQAAGALCLETALDGAADGARLDARAMLGALGQAGLTSVLVEGGALLAASLLRAGLVDRIAWFHAPCVIGGDGTPAIAGMAIDALSDMRRFRRVAVRPVGDDLLSEYSKA